MDDSAPTTKKCPWEKVVPPTVPFSLTDVMSEQLASDLQDQDTDPVLLVQQYENQLEIGVASAASALPEPFQLDEQTENDFIIAQLLQLELNKEHDEQLKRQEEVINRNSRGSIKLTAFFFLFLPEFPH